MMADRAERIIGRPRSSVNEWNEPLHSVKCAIPEEEHQVLIVACGLLIPTQHLRISEMAMSKGPQGLASRQGHEPV